MQSQHPDPIESISASESVDAALLRPSLVQTLSSRIVIVPLVALACFLCRAQTFLPMTQQLCVVVMFAAYVTVFRELFSVRVSRAGLAVVGASTTLRWSKISEVSVERHEVGLAGWSLSSTAGEVFVAESIARDARFRSALERWAPTLGERAFHGRAQD